VGPCTNQGIGSDDGSNIELIDIEEHGEDDDDDATGGDGEGDGDGDGEAAVTQNLVRELCSHVRGFQ
jgi:hypothetical protein